VRNATAAVLVARLLQLAQRAAYSEVDHGRIDDAAMALAEESEDQT